MKIIIPILFLLSLILTVIFGENMAGNAQEIVTIRTIASIGIVIFGVWQSILLLKPTS